MNRDQVKGVAKHIKGQVQQEVGKMTGDTSTRVRGQAKELEGRLQKGLGDANETVRHDERELNEVQRRKGH
jgi:uncharacterized protein YjbJ (UPF0337 family)